LAQAITLTTAPTSDLTLTVTPPTNTSGFSGFVTFDGAVTNNVTFTPSKTSTNISICSYSSTTTGQTYTFALNLSGTNMSSYYLSNSALGLTVVDMKNLTFPATITVPKSGCSATQSLNISNSLTNSLTATLGISGTGVYLASPSGGAFLLNSSNTGSPISFILCSYDNVTVGQTINAAITLSGQSSPEVRSNVNVVAVTIGSVPNATISLSTTLAPDTTNESYYNVTAIPSINGNFYYFVQETTNVTSNVSLVNIKANITANKSVIFNQSDYTKYLYSNPRDYYLGVLTMVAGQTSNITITHYFPSTSYLLCGYLQSSDGTTTSNITCDSYTSPTQTNTIIYTTMTVSSDLSSTERNEILCAL
jgi:hypothetical protein